MRIQHNIMAMNAYRNYNTNTSALSKNLEKLASGYKINRAGDDAAGLAISEKMRAQITGLSAAQKNVKDGVSLVKTAEGAMQEIQDMLNRMDYLATQSANGTYDNEVDRANLQKEVDALRTEINRIADSSNFNGIKLLDGSLEKVEACGAYTETITTEGRTVEGKERILKSIIGDSDIAYKVAGQKTILDTPSATATIAKFEVDLKDLRFTNYATSQGTLKSITISINGQIVKTDISVSITGSKGEISSTAATTIASKVATQMKTTWKTNTSGLASAITLNGVDWKVSASNGKLKFEQVKVPKTYAEAQANFDVKVTNVNITNKASQCLVVTGAIKSGTYVTQAGVPQDGNRRAHTVFQIKADDIRDGTKITIGTTSVTLAVGAKSIHKADSKASGYVDLMDMEAGKIDTEKLFVALGRISEAFGSEVSVLKTANGDKLESIRGSDVSGVNFQVGVTSGRTNGVEWAGISVSRSDNGTQCVFDTLDKLSSIFKIEVEDGTQTIDHDEVQAQDGLRLQIGDTADDFNQMTVAVGDMHTKAMTFESEDGEKSSIADIDIGTQEGAVKAIEVIKNAINYVSSVRGDLGAAQNRLEHTANNLSVMAENIQDAESTIRDTDIADEMMSYTKNNILVQSAQAMLAQANAVPQGVLQLLG